MFILYNKFKKQKDDLSESQFRDLLIDNYKSKKQLTREEAAYEVDNMLLNKRRVREGDYAILDIGGGSFEYYTRNENKWIKDTNLTGKIEIKDNKLFCNLQESCIDINNNCENLTVAQEKTEDQILKEIYKDFEDNYDDKDLMLKEEIDQKLINSINFIKITKKYKKLFVKQSYLLMTWVWYIQQKHTSSIKPSFVFKPTKLNKLTLIKSPMAHKTFSQEQFQFKFYSLLISFSLN